MITATLMDGTRRVIPVGSNTMGSQFSAIEITSASDVISDDRALDWFLTAVLTRLAPAGVESVA